VKFNYVRRARKEEITSLEGECTVSLEDPYVRDLNTELIVKVIFTSHNLEQIVWLNNLIPLDAKAELFLVKAKLGVFNVRS